MRTVQVHKDRLLETLRKNREQHKAEFEKAWKGFRKAYIENVESILDETKNGGPVRLHINLTQPQAHTDDYDRAIEMLDWETGDEVELTEQEFSQFVQDDWGWKQQFTTTNAMYSGR